MFMPAGEAVSFSALERRGDPQRQVLDRRLQPARRRWRRSPRCERGTIVPQSRLPSRPTSSRLKPAARGRRPRQLNQKLDRAENLTASKAARGSPTSRTREVGGGGGTGAAV